MAKAWCCVQCGHVNIERHVWCWQCGRLHVKLAERKKPAIVVRFPDEREAFRITKGVLVDGLEVDHGPDQEQS